MEIQLPRLCGSRQAAKQLVDQFLPQLDQSKLLQVNARLTTVGTEAFSDEFVLLMKQASAKKLLVTPTTLEFERNLLAAGRKHGLAVELVG